MAEKKSIWNLLQQSDDQEMDFAIVAPYMETKFCDWLKEAHHITDKRYLQEFIDSYMSAYERIYNEVNVDVYSAFVKLFKHGNSLADFALDFFNIVCVDTMYEMLESDENAFTKKEIRSINYYMEFLASMTEYASDYTTVKLEIPYVEEFKVWLESIKMQYENIVKVISSMQCILSWYKYTSLYSKYNNPYFTAIALETNKQREDFLELIDSESKHIIQQIHTKKTIQNSMSNIRQYFNFLNGYLKK